MDPTEHTFDTIITALMLKRVREQNEAISQWLGLALHGTIEVDLRPPRWLPNRVYLWLMRTIIVKARA